MLAGAAEALRRAMGAPQRPRDKAGLDDALAALTCDAGTTAAARAAGARMPPADVIRYALDESDGSDHSQESP